MNIKIRVGKRTGDDSYIYKKKQIENPEEILLTTPESLALMITRKEVDQIFKSTTYLAIDELNEIIWAFFNSPHQSTPLEILYDTLLTQKEIFIIQCNER